MASGVGLWIAFNKGMKGRTVEATYGMAVLAILVTLGLIISLQGMWLLGGLLLIMAVLLIVVLVAYAIQTTS
jgi:hypothetical protein